MKMSSMFVDVNAMILVTNISIICQLQAETYKGPADNVSLLSGRLVAYFL